MKGLQFQNISIIYLRVTNQNQNQTSRNNQNLFSIDHIKITLFADNSIIQNKPTSQSTENTPINNIQKKKEINHTTRKWTKNKGIHTYISQL